MCNYTSNYNYNVKRHRLIHNKKNQSDTQNDDTQSINQSSTSKNQVINSPYPVQAINLANNVQIPPTTKQIINIQPPTNISTSIIRKPVLHDDNQKFFDVRLKENFKLFISGPSRSGKTEFVKKLTDNADIFMKSPPKIVTLVYKVFQPIYYNMNVDHLVHDGSDPKQRLINIANGEPMMIIFDDLINSDSLTELSNMFVVDGRHMKFSMIFISQKLFVNNEHYRQISLNCDYYIIFKNPRNALEIRNLASQMTPGNMDLVSYYMMATKQPFSYLYINLTQECDYQVKYLSHLFNEAHTIQCYFHSKSNELIDGNTQGRTNFQRMYINDGRLKTVNDNVHDYSSDVVTPVYVNNRKGNIISQDFMNSNTAHKSSSTDSMNMYDKAISTDLVNRTNKSMNTDFVNKKNNFTSTNLKLKDASVSVNTPMNDKSVSTSLMYDKRNIGTSPINTLMNDKSISTNLMNDKRNIRTSAMNDNGLSTYVDRRNISTSTDHDFGEPMQITPSSNDLTTQGVSYDNRHSLYNKRGMLPNHERPERQWKLNPPIYTLIKKPENRYKNYSEYDISNTSTYDDIPNALTYDNDIPHALTYDNDIHNASTYENVLVPYQDYSAHNDGTCTYCQETFHSKNALKRHQASCKPSVYACNVCGKNLLTRLSLTRHVRAMHQNRKDIRSVEQNSPKK